VSYSLARLLGLLCGPIRVLNVTDDFLRRLLGSTSDFVRSLGRFDVQAVTD
jgi:hypothetical protein